MFDEGQGRGPGRGCFDIRVWTEKKTFFLDCCSSLLTTIKVHHRLLRSEPLTSCLVIKQIQNLKYKVFLNVWLRVFGT